LNVTIIGINEIGFESGNPLISSAGDMPMLQDVEAVNLWDSWAVTYRDVIIVGPDGKKVGVYNLTANNLNNDTPYAELKAMLLDAANLP
tara:strand:- start:25 stop:291 length:267 start_codon:yes stop_codon:yes gene_type:complete